MVGYPVTNTQDKHVPAIPALAAILRMDFRNRLKNKKVPFWYVLGGPKSSFLIFDQYSYCDLRTVTVLQGRTAPRGN